MKKKLLLVLVLILSSLSSFSSEEKSEEKVEASKEVDLNFSKIKDLIKKDGLEGELKKKEDEKRKYLTDKKLKDVRRFNIPTQDDFWSFFSELWLIKNATVLKWDFQKPDFELEKSFVSFLETQGFYEKKVKILLLDTSEITHAALPSSSNELILIVSLPFIRSMDLSKTEISLILFEDFIRLRKGYLKNYVLDKELEGILGTNFEGKKIDKKILDTHLKKYNQVLFEKGFSFQEQFETTKEVDSLLKGDMKIWNTYFGLIEKIDNLMKNNVLFKKYGLIYPSPELQINWLKPKSSPL